MQSKLRVIDLFAGVGGLSLGAARAGFEVILAVEKDPHAFKAHTVNFPNSGHSDADISRLTGQRLLSIAGLERGELDGLIGGPPCQGFSSIGARTKSDARNGLFTKFFQLVQETAPKFFVAENVLGILNSQHDSLRNRSLDLIAEDYSLLEPLRLKACDFGAPTSRERAFFIGYRKDLQFSFTQEDFLAGKVTTPTLVANALFGLPSIRSDWREEEQGWRRVAPLPEGLYAANITANIPEGVGDAEALRMYKQRIVSGCLGTAHSAKLRARYGALRPGQQDRATKSVRLRKSGFCPTLRAGTGSDRGSFQAVRPIHPTAPRVITPREAARLQGFPDWFRFAPSKWHSFRQIGNSVSPFVAEAVMSVIYKRLTSHHAF